MGFWIKLRQISMSQVKVKVHFFSIQNCLEVPKSVVKMIKSDGRVEISQKLTLHITSIIWESRTE